MLPRKQRQQQERSSSKTSRDGCKKLTHGPLQSLECKGGSLAEISYRGQTIRTPIAAPTVQKIFLDRLWKEIIEPCQITSRKKLYDKNGEILEWKELRKRFRFGINVCTRALELHSFLKDRSAIQLVVVASNAVPVATHIPLLCQASTAGTQQQNQEEHLANKNIPLLLLDQKSIEELSRRHFPQFRRVTCLAISASSLSGDLDMDDPLDSFLSFIVSKL